MCHDYLGGYGLGARLLYDRLPVNADPMGPGNILGFLTGPLTGTPALIGSRLVVVAKSPKTNTWGDANCGGYWGSMVMGNKMLKAVVVTGAMAVPMYDTKRLNAIRRRLLKEKEGFFDTWDRHPGWRSTPWISIPTAARPRTTGNS